MKKLFLLLILSISLFACVPEDHVLEIEIRNNTLEPVQDLQVVTAGDRTSFKADNLPPGEVINHTLQVKGNFADGNYTFSFSRKNGEQESTTGSYTEEKEGALKKTLVFNIQEQGVEVEQRALEVE